MENQNPTKRSRLSMRLDTLVLLMTLAAVAVGFIKARSDSIKWQAQLSRNQTATGLPHVKDVTKLEVVNEQGRGTPSWTVWVPYGKTCRLRIATQQVEIPFPTEFDEFQLSAGRHSVGIATGPSAPKLQLKLDGNEILVKEKTRIWNVAGVPETMVRDSIQPDGDTPVVLFRRFGRIRPSVDEEWEMRKHRVGLLIWVQP